MEKYKTFTAIEKKQVVIESVKTEYELPLYVKNSKDSICGPDDVEIICIDEYNTMTAVQIDSFRYASITSDFATSDSLNGYMYKSSKEEFELARQVAIGHFQTGRPVREILEEIDKGKADV